MSHQAPGVNSPLGLSRSDKVRIAVVYSTLGLATVLAFVASITVGSITTVLAGPGVVAYVLGLRHGMDADHIAAIDNTTRKLIRTKTSVPSLWACGSRSAIR